MLHFLVDEFVSHLIDRQIDRSDHRLLLLKLTTYISILIINYINIEINNL